MDFILFFWVGVLFFPLFYLVCWKKFGNARKEKTETTVNKKGTGTDRNRRRTKIKILN